MRAFLQFCPPNAIEKRTMFFSSFLLKICCFSTENSCPKKLSKSYCLLERESKRSLKKKICSLTVRVLTQLRRTKKGSAGPNSKLLIFHHDSSKCLDLLLFWSVSFLCFLTASGWCGLKWTIDCSGQFPKIFVINESRVYRRQSIH